LKKKKIEMSGSREHQWVNTGRVNNRARRTEDKYCIFCCTGCGQEVWHYYDITWSPTDAIEAERIPRECRPGFTQLVTHRQVEEYIRRERENEAQPKNGLSKVSQYVHEMS
jgi:hypothetical protein